MQALLKKQDAQQDDKQGNQLVLELSGDLDQLSLKKDYLVTIDKNEKKRLTGIDTLMVSLKAVERADSAGLAWLLNLKRDLKKLNITVSIHHSPSKLIELAKLSNADRFLE